MNTKDPANSKRSDDDNLLTAAEVAELMKISKRTLWRLVSTGEVPQPIRFGGNVRWLKKVLTFWIDNGCPSSTDRENVPIDFDRS